MSRGDRVQLLRTQSRMGLVMAVPGLIMLAVIGKAFVIQVVEVEIHGAAAGRQQAGLTRKSARRGSIVDRRGAILAHSAPGRSVYADPSAVEDPAAAAKSIGTVL